MATFATIYDDQGNAYRVTIGFDAADNPTLCIAESPAPAPTTGCCQWIHRPCWIECSLLGMVSRWAPRVVDLKRDMILAGYDPLWRQLVNAVNGLVSRSESVDGYTNVKVNAPVRQALKAFQHAVGTPSDSVQIGIKGAGACDIDHNHVCCKPTTHGGTPADAPVLCNNNP